MKDVSWMLGVGCACLGGLMLTGGCNIIGIAGPIARAAHEAGSTTYPAEYQGLEGQTFAVIVQADASLRMNQPRLVNVLTNAATRTLSQNTLHAGYVPGPKVLEFQYSTPRWTAWEPLRIADELTVDRLVVIDLVEYRMNEPGNSHLWDGRAIARVEVYEAEYESNEPAFASEVRVKYPDGTGYSRQEMPGRQVAANLQKRLIDRCCWLMYEHTLPNTHEY